ncbi:MAG: hypothetical protein QW620_01780 [Thermoplasmata archaeon]
MHFRVLVILAVAAVCLESQFVISLAQSTPELVLIASFDRQGVYHTGETLNLTIFAYLGETPMDLDEIYVNLTDIYGSNLLPLNPTKISTGKYLVQYTLTSDDLEKRFMIVGNVSGVKKVIYLSLPFDSPTVVYISFPDEDAIPLVPGKNVRFNVECYQNATLTQPENIVAFLETEGSQKPLNLSKEGEGRYSGNFIVPSLNKSANFKITASARIKGKIEMSSVSLDYIPLSVWYHSVRISENSASFDLGLCDQNGRGVPNATILLNYTTDLGSEKKWAQGFTNAEGIAHFYLAPEVIMNPYIYVWGKAQSNELETNFMLSIPLSTTERASSGFDVLVHNSTYLNGSLIINGTVYNNTKPFTNSNFFYFLNNWGEVHGNFSTDPNGNFSIQIKKLEEKYIHPYFGITIVFVSKHTPSLRSEKIIWFNLSTDRWLDASLILEHEEINFGKILMLKLQHKNNFLFHMLYPPFAIIYDGEIKTTGDFYSSWSPVIASVYFIPLNTTTMRCSLPLPAFAYTGQKNITVGAIYYEPGTFVPHMVAKNVLFVPDFVANFSLSLAGEDYLVVKWDKYEGEDFVKYEVLLEGEGGWISIANLTDKNITHYRITSVNGEPLKGGKEYRIKLRVHFDKRYVEEIVITSTLPKVPGFITSELVVYLLLILFAIVVIAKLKGKR